MAQVWFATKDPGGTNNLLPTLDQLAKRTDCLLIANGAASKLPQVVGREHVDAVDAMAFLREQEELPRVLVTSMCSDGGIGRDLVPLLRSRDVTIVALQDQWGGQQYGDRSWADPTYRPDYLVVNDRVGKEITLRAWPDFPQGRVVVLGYASLDAYQEIDITAARNAVREKLSISSTPAVYFSGQLRGTSAALEVLVSALNAVGQEAVLLVGMHPRFVPTDPALEYERTERALESAATHVRVMKLPGGPDRIPEQDVIAAANIVTSMWSTALMSAAAIRKPAVSIVFPGSEMQRYYGLDTGGLMSRHPLVDLGAVAGPSSVKELEAALIAALDGTLGLEVAQREHVVVNGRNAQHVAGFITSLLN